MIGVPDNLTAETQIQVSVTSSSRVNQTVTVTADNGVGGTELIQVYVDETGSGSANWTVPAWQNVTFSDGACTEQIRTIS